MNRGRTIVLLLAVVCAALAMFMMKNLVKSPKTKVVTQELSETQVLVAGSDINLGEPVKGNSLKWQPWPASSSSGYITKQSNPRAAEELVGAIARVNIGAGDPIRQQKLVKLEQGGVMAAILPAGYRALSIEIDNEQGVSGLILPNDRVDVVLTSKAKGEQQQAGSETLLLNVRVLAIGENFETKDGQKSIKGKTATLALTPEQVEVITQARNRGSLWLSLRSIADAAQSSETAKRQANSSVRILKYGVASQTYGLE
jgi:pilus assembly protein CpaB